jgi:hydroxyacylglutathione hydrolase
VGYERRNNPALGFDDRDRFIEHMASDQPLKPANILHIVATNQGRRGLTRGTPSVKSLDPAQVQARMADGHILVDARSSAAWGAGHVPGSYNVQASSSEFEQRVGWVVPDGTPIVLLAETDDEARRCLWEMAFIGLDRSVTGFLEGGIDTWMRAGLPLATVQQIDVFSVHRRREENGLAVLDVRTADEWRDGHIADAHFMPYTSLAPQLEVPAQWDALDLDRDGPIAVTCAAGNRSSTAISLMLRQGFRNVLNVTGGMEAWNHAGLPKET